MAKVANSRSGRVVIDGGTHKQIITADSGNMGLIYRIFNGGKDGAAVKLTTTNSLSSMFTIPPATEST